MRMVFILVLMAGLGLAGFAVKMARDYIGAYETALAQERQRATAAIATQPIYIAARPLSYGQKLTAADVRLAHYPVDILPEGHFGAERPILAEGDPARVVLRAMEANEPILAVKVSEPGGDAGITSRLNRGERAFAIKVDVATGVSGFLRPGDLVDVYWTGQIRSNDPNLPQGDVTRLIESGIRLIAIDQTANTDSTEVAIARTVTVAATPTEVAALAQAQSTGRLSLSLIALDDDTVVEDIEMDQRTLLGLETQVAEAPVAPQREETCSIRTRRGGEIVETPIPCTN